MAGPQPLAYSTAAFRRERESEWQAFETLVARLEHGSIRALSDDDLLALPRYYRATLSSLSIARTTSLDAALIDYLESLAMRGYFLLYGVQESRGRRVWDFFRADWSAAVRSLWLETLVITALFFLAALTAWVLIRSDASWFQILIPGQMAQGREPGASADLLRKTIFGPPEDSNFHIFATFLFTNNAGVAIIGYALGFAFGLPTMMLMFQQGLSLGALLSVFSDAGLAVDFLGWIAIHGTTELLAIFIAGGAGLRIGTAVAFPGTQTRLGAAAQAGKATGAAMIGVILMLIVAGLLEGFARQLIQSTALRYAVGGAMLAFWLSYFYLPRRSGRAVQ